MCELNTLPSRKIRLTALNDTAAYRCSGIIDSGVLDQSMTLPLKTPDARRFWANNGYGSRRRSNVASAVTSSTRLSTADLPHRRPVSYPARNTVKLTVLRMRQPTNMGRTDEHNAAAD